MASIDGSVRHFLEAHRVGRLGSVDSQGRPHVVPICFAVTAQRIYSVIDEKPKRVDAGQLKRIKNILGNPHVCLTVDEYSDDWNKLGFVMVHGTAKVIYSGQEHQLAASLLRQRYIQYRDIGMRERPVLTIQPERIVTWGRV